MTITFWNNFSEAANGEKYCKTEDPDRESILGSLPPELAIKIGEHLTLPDILSLRLVGKSGKEMAWIMLRNFFQSNELMVNLNFKTDLKLLVAINNEGKKMGEQKPFLTINAIMCLDEGVNKLLPLSEFIKNFKIIGSLWEIKKFKNHKLAKQLKHLNLSEANTPTLVHALSFFENLESLNLTGPNISLFGLAQALTSLKILKSLDLSNHPIDGDDGKNIAEALMVLTKLESLNLSKSYIGPMALKPMAEALKSLKNLKSLNLSNIKDIGESSKYIAPALRSLTKLQALKLSCLENYEGDIIEDSVLLTIQESLPYLTELNLLQLSAIILNCSSAEALGEALKSLSELRSLDLSVSRIDDRKAVDTILEGLKSLKKLRTLNLESFHLTSENIDALSVALKSLPNLKCLNLSYNDFDYEKAEVIAEALSTLREIESLNLGFLDMNNKSIGDILVALPSPYKLKSLTLSSINIETTMDKIVMTLNTFKNLESLDLSKNAFDLTILTRLDSLHHLKALDISYNDMEEIGDAIAEILICFSKLESLNLSHTVMSNKEIKIIAEALKSLPYLRVFSFSNQNLSSDGLSTIAMVVSSLKNLESLDLARCGIGSEGAKDIVKIFLSLKKLKVFDLSGNSIAKTHREAINSTKHNFMPQLKIKF